MEVGPVAIRVFVRICVSMDMHKYKVIKDGAEALHDMFWICLFAISGQDRNFALERYGTDSRCFDHTEQMWEERSCEQVMFDIVSNKKGYNM